ncbi:Hypothetical predicted protein [Podarcis lilfordi]|uniref:Uncharacterized protein n=1 Tax=Podarcis lilfordi TaxID=74358 RepID=A0AA35QQT9_9SAUR|nr:Hypothetical predicted protein [Podarcis lilfordi]
MDSIWSLLCVHIGTHMMGIYMHRDLTRIHPLFMAMHDFCTCTAIKPGISHLTFVPLVFPPQVQNLTFVAVEIHFVSLGPVLQPIVILNSDFVLQASSTLGLQMF